MASQNHQIMITKAFEFIRCRDPICGIGYEIVRNILPDKLTTILWPCFIPLRALQWKSALTNFDPDLENFIEDAAHICRPLLREVLRQCDRLFAAKHRDVAVGLLGALHRELDCIGLLPNATSGLVKHMKNMVVSRLRVLCPLLLDSRERQHLHRSTMNICSAAIIRLDEETAAFLSDADLMWVQCIIQLQHSWHEDEILEKLALSIGGKIHPCLRNHAFSTRLGGGSNPVPQAACYCHTIWETIKHDISNFFQITAESLSSLLHSNIGTTFPIRSDDNKVEWKRLGDILDRVFRQAGVKPCRLGDIALFRRAMAFVPEFVFGVLPLLTTSEIAPSTRSQRCRRASAYRHSLLLSTIVQACALVDQFCREVAITARHPFWPFEDWLLKRREADVLDAFFEALVWFQSIHSQILEGKADLDLPEI